MNTDVEYVLNKILNNLVVGEGNCQFPIQFNMDSGAMNLTKDLGNEEKLFLFETPALETTSGFINDTYAVSSKCRKLSSTSSSSGFEDLSGSKANNYDIAEENFCQKVLNVVVNKSEENEVLSKIDSIENLRILTSTPKKQNNANNECISPREKQLHCEIENLSGEYFEMEKTSDYLNTTIDEAIRRYEKGEEKFKSVYVQTNPDEFSVSKGKCNCQISKMKEEEILLQESKNFPPFKKFKSENTLIRTSKNARKILDVMDIKGKNDGTNKYWVNESNERIIDELPISVSTVISVGRENFGFSKVPRIRVGLSKRMKPKKTK